jgi:hypothetical protein
MIQKWGLYIGIGGNLYYGWLEPVQLWLPFEHLDFIYANMTRSEVSFWNSRGPLS